MSALRDLTTRDQMDKKRQHYHSSAKQYICSMDHWSRIWNNKRVIQTPLCCIIHGYHSIGYRATFPWRGKQKSGRKEPWSIRRQGHKRPNLGILRPVVSRHSSLAGPPISVRSKLSSKQGQNHTIFCSFFKGLIRGARKLLQFDLAS